MISSHLDLRGLWVPIVTPFSERGELDIDSLERLAGNILGAGAAGIVALGTTGEPATLTAAERRRVVEVCDDVCRRHGRRLIVGAGTNSTSGTIDEIAHLTDDTSTAAVLIVVPYYTCPSPQAIVEHLVAVADASAVPIVAYNVPWRTGRGLGAADLVELSRHQRIVGLKQAVGALDIDTLEVLAAVGDDLQVLCGDDAFIAPTILMGGVGAIAAAANVRTDAFAELTRRALDGDADGARAAARALLPVVTIGFSEPSPAVWKGTLARLGSISSHAVRRPLTAASAATIERHLEAVQAVQSHASQ